MATTEKKIEPKTIALIVAVVIVVALAVWQGSKAVTGASTDVTYTPKVKPPPESARPSGFGSAPNKGESRTGAED